MKGAAFYARPGSAVGDLVTILHPPYTAWHLSYVVIGSALAPTVDAVRLGGTLLAFFLGTGIGAHALDERHSRPLGTGLSDRTLLGLVVLGFGGGLALAVAAAFIISPLVLVWAGIGTVLAVAYAGELSPMIHSDPGFGLAWGSFPTLVGYWSQTERIGVPVLLVALAAMMLSMAQRRLSTPARYMRRSTIDAEVHIETANGAEVWGLPRLLAGWEQPLRLLSWAMVTLSLGLVAARL